MKQHLILELPLFPQLPSLAVVILVIADIAAKGW